MSMAEREPSSTMASQFGILGPLCVRDEAGEVVVSGARRRALLVRLLIAGNQPVPTDRLAEDLWEGHPPPGAASTLRSHVSLLRRSVGADRLQMLAGSYSLVVAHDELDVNLFEEDSHEGRRALAAGDALGAAAHLVRAIRHWRGAPLFDVDGAAWALPEVARLGELRLATLEALFDARLALGDLEEVIAGCQKELAEHPFRERFWAQLMLALYRSDRQADALRAYQRLRTRLGEELGIEPSAELAALEQRILLQRADLNAAPSEMPRRKTRPSAGSLPAVLAPAPMLGVIGRSAEVEQLRSALADVVGGTLPRHALVAGEAGIGKSTIVAQVARQAHDQQVLVVCGRCDEQLAVPYSLASEFVTQLLEAGGPELLDDLDDTHVRAIAQLGAPVRRLIQESEDDARRNLNLDAEIEPWLLSRAVELLLTAVSRRQPVMLIVEDLHWADATTAQMVGYLAGRPIGRVFVVVTYRNDMIKERPSLAEFLGSQARQPNLTRVTLAGLTEDEVGTFVGTAARHPLDSQELELARAISRETDGNPFFVQEITLHLVESGQVEPGPHTRWRIPKGGSVTGLPDTVRSVVGARVARLGEVAQDLLSAGAVIGPQFDIDLLVDSTRTSESETLELLERAEASALLREDAESPGHFRFAHGIVHRTVYEGIGPTRRALLHRQVFEVLSKRTIESSEGETGGISDGELARHFLAFAKGSELAEAVGYAKRAAEEAVGALNPAEASRWYTAALDALGSTGDDSTRAPLLCRLGDAQRQAGESVHRETLLDAARLALRVGDVDTLVSAALSNSRQIQSATGEVDQERVEVLEAALDKVGTADSPRRARLLAHLAVDLTWDGDPSIRRDLIEDALSTARRLGDDATLFDVLIRRVGIWVPDDVGQRLAESDEATQIAERLGDPVNRFWAWFYRSIVATEAGDPDELHRCSVRFPAEAEAVGQPTLRWVTAYAQSCRSALRGDLEAAEAQALEALELGNATGQPDALSLYGGQLIVIRWHQGRDDELVDIVAGMVDATPTIPAFRAALARIRADLGQHEEVRKLLSTEAENQFPHPVDPLLASTLVMWADAAVQAADKDAACILLNRLAPLPDQIVCNGVTTFGSLDHYRGALCAVLGRRDEAEKYLSKALAVHGRLGAPFFEARSCLELSQLLHGRAQGQDHSYASYLRDRAAAVAEHHGFANVSRKAARIDG